RVHDRPARPGCIGMMRLLLPLLLCVSPLAFAQEGGGAAVTFGSKNFTESVVLGEVGAGLARQAGDMPTHRRQLGGTRIVWRALIDGEIDGYVEYTGTLAQELLRMPGADIDALRAELETRGVRKIGRAHV